MANNRIDGDLNVDGVVNCAGLQSTTATITDAMFSSATSARLTTEKQINRLAVGHAQKHGTAITAQTNIIHIARGAGTFIKLAAVITGVIPGADTVTVDIQKSTGGGAFATILSSVLTFTSADTIRVSEATTSFAVTSYAAGDLIACIVTASGSTAQGLGVTLHVDENPS